MSDSRKYTFENLIGVFERIYSFRMWFDELFEYWIHCTQNAPYVSEVRTVWVNEVIKTILNLFIYFTKRFHTQKNASKNKLTKQK